MINPQQAAWQRQAVYSNLASQGAGVQTVLPPPQFLNNNNQQSQNRPAWDGWAGAEDQRMDLENSSADSFPHSSYNVDPNQHSPGTAGTKFEMDTFPKMEPAARWVYWALQFRLCNTNMAG